jgi:hypothetical protein
VLVHVKQSLKRLTLLSYRETFTIFCHWKGRSMSYAGCKIPLASTWDSVIWGMENFTIVSISTNYLFLPSIADPSWLKRQRSRFVFGEYRILAWTQNFLTSFSWFSFIRPSKCRSNTSIVPLSLPFYIFQIHYSLIIPSIKTTSTVNVCGFLQADTMMI